MEDETPDLREGVAIDAILDRPFAGNVDGQSVILMRVDGSICAVSGECTHLGAPLETGLVVGNQIRCPWHHARFSISTGEAIGAPAFKPLSCYTVEERDGVVRVTGETAPRREPLDPIEARKIVIIGGGAAGHACADMLARAGHGKCVTVLSADRDPPYDRTFCSKHYLAGEKSRDECLLPQAGLRLGPPPEIRTGVEVTSVDIAAREVVTSDGERIRYDVLVLATGAEPHMPDFMGAEHEAVHVIRTLADTDALIEAAANAKTAAILGASFIGLEAAASLVSRGLDVTVIAQDEIPLSSVLGEDVGRFVRALHEKKGVLFRLGRKLASYDGVSAILDDGSTLQADLLVVGAGVTPRLALAKAAGLQLAKDDDGIAVDGYFATSAAHVVAIGDIASCPDVRLGRPIRVEHWVHAQRQGQHLARLLTGETAAPFGDTPFFWSTHHDIGIHYVGHSSTPKVSRRNGVIDDGDFALFFADDGKEQALVTLERDILSLETEAAWEEPLQEGRSAP